MRLHSEGKSIKAITRICEVSKNTVRRYIRSPELTEVGLSKLSQLEDKELSQLIEKPAIISDKERYGHFLNLSDYFSTELKRVGVTRHLLWQEYLQQYPSGYSYSQFCWHLQQQRKSTELSMMLDHKAGDRLYIDFTGKRVSYYDPQTGEEQKAEVLVACLGYSQKAVVLALESQRSEHFIAGLDDVLHLLGGCSHAIVPDNMKTAVIKSDRYEPTINRVLEDFANHYQTTILPARALHPKDKSLAENLVRLAYSRVYAPLRNQTFTSLKEINQAFSKQVEKHNLTPFQRKEYCRQQLFETSEKDQLKPLPSERFQIKKYRSYKVQKTSMFFLSQDEHYYSVPYAYISQQVEVIYTLKTVLVYYKNKCIASHKRIFQRYGKTYLPEHFPSWHNDYKDRSPDYYRKRAEKYGLELQEVITKVLHRKLYPELNYKNCDGILSLAVKTSEEVFQNACKIALMADKCTYKYIQKIILNGAAEHLIEDTQQKPLPNHGNLRGKEFYTQFNQTKS